MATANPVTGMHENGVLSNGMCHMVRIQAISMYRISSFVRQLCKVFIIHQKNLGLRTNTKIIEVKM